MKGKKKDNNEEEEERGKKERMVNLTLEMIYLLTGEHYIPRKKSDDGGALHAPGSVIQKENNKNDKKILELMSNIIQLLTGEVAIRTHHVSIYFSLDEWDYIKGNKDLYEEGMKEEGPQQLRPLDCEYEDKRDITADLGGTICYNNEPTKNGAEGADLCAIGNLTKSEISPVEQPPPANGIKEEVASWEGGNQSDCRINPLTEQIQGTDTITPIMEGSLNKNSNDVPSVSIFQRMYKFTECPISVSKKTGLVNQERILFSDDSLISHLKKRISFSCSECGKCFNHRSSLKAHRNIHSGERPYCCSECGKCFAQRPSLKRHQKTHLDGNPFSCYECGKRFAKRKYLAAHLKIHSGVKPFSCSECGKCFVRSTHLSLHQRVHTGEKPYSCCECGKCFIDSSTLNRHRKTHTGKETSLLL
ncbi:hypothetical protein XELAEV_18001427mg [Xenopus laevis]|nr:hypothetical protein XELAEV_18001427mg [Xenopus laevis]